jgi:hypothetical protein
MSEPLGRDLPAPQVALEKVADARVGAADLIPLPGSHRAGVEPELPGKRFLGESLRLAGGPDSAA